MGVRVGPPRHQPGIFFVKMLSYLFLFLLPCLSAASSFQFQQFLAAKHRLDELQQQTRFRRSFEVGGCPAFEPFRCPDSGHCISIQYLCDGAPDCGDSYDENPKLCTAARRPPVEETSSFLKSLLASHGPNYLEKLFGPKARNNLAQLGGVDEVAIALSESQTIEEFGDKMKLHRTDVEHL